MESREEQFTFIPKGERSSDSDSDLLSRFSQGDDRAATYLYYRYGERIRALAREQCAADLSSRFDAEDIVQSVFRSFFHGVARGQFQVGEEEDLWKLLLVITLNTVRSTGEYHRAAKRDVRATNAGKVRARVPRSSSEQDLAELRLLIADILLQFPESGRRIVQLRIEGHSVPEIAQQTGRSRRTVERVLQGFRHILQEKLAVDD